MKEESIKVFFDEFVPSLLLVQGTIFFIAFTAFTFIGSDKAFSRLFAGLVCYGIWYIGERIKDIKLDVKG